MTNYFIAAGLGYLLGSIPFGLILVRLFRGTDIRSTGSGNIGAANVARVAPGLGALTLLFDAAKGYAAVCAARMVLGQHPFALGIRPDDIVPLLAVAGLCAVVGHIFPVWLNFKGGKGVATAMGVYLALVPTAVVLVTFIFLIVLRIWHYSSLASIVSAAVFPLVAYFAIPNSVRWQLLPFLAIISVSVIARHYQNIERLRSGTENQLRFGRK